MSQLLGVFGMYEMERAAEVVLGRAEYDYRVAAQHFIERDAGKGSYFIDGLLNLVECGFMARGMYNGEFVPTQKFWDRLREKGGFYEPVFCPRRS